MGNSGHSTDGIRQTVEYLRAGAIGTVKEAHSWVPASRWNPELKGLPQGETPLDILDQIEDPLGGSGGVQ
jgi:hypothetical protein